MHRITYPFADMEQNTGNGPMEKKPALPFDSPVRIHIHSIRKRLVDPDGISAKAAIDGLIHAGVLRDDSAAEVKEVSYSQEAGAEEKTILAITGCLNDAVLKGAGFMLMNSDGVSHVERTKVLNESD